jgi:hypothetical protein
VLVGCGEKEMGRVVWKKGRGRGGYREGDGDIVIEER